MNSTFIRSVGIWLDTNLIALRHCLYINAPHWWMRSRSQWTRTPWFFLFKYKFTTHIVDTYHIHYEVLIITQTSCFRHKQTFKDFICFVVLNHNSWIEKFTASSEWAHIHLFRGIIEQLTRPYFSSLSTSEYHGSFKSISEEWISASLYHSKLLKNLKLLCQKKNYLFCTSNGDTSLSLPLSFPASLSLSKTTFWIWISIQNES